MIEIAATDDTTGHSLRVSYDHDGLFVLSGVDNTSSGFEFGSDDLYAMLLARADTSTGQTKIGRVYGPTNVIIADFWLDKLGEGEYAVCFSEHGADSEPDVISLECGSPYWAEEHTFPLLDACPYGLTHYGLRPLATEDDLSEVTEEIQELAATVEGKQDALTAGENITIVDDVISASVPQGSRLDQHVTQVSCSKPSLADGIPISLFGIQRVTLTGAYIMKPSGRNGSVTFRTFESGNNRIPVSAEGLVGGLGGYSASGVIGHASGSIGGSLPISFSATGGWPDGWNPKTAVLNGLVYLDHSETLSSGHKINLAIIFSTIGTGNLSPGACAVSGNVVDVWISRGTGYDPDTDWALVEALTSVNVASADTIDVAGSVRFI